MILRNGEFWNQAREGAFWNEFDFLVLAKFAQLVNRFQSSIYFVEVWANIQQLYVII